MKMPSLASANHCIFARIESGLILSCEKPGLKETKETEKIKKNFNRIFFFIIQNLNRSTTYDARALYKKSRFDKTIIAGQQY